jgi:cell division protein FtsQ
VPKEAMKRNIIIKKVLLSMGFLGLLGLLAFSNIEQGQRKFSALEVEMNYAEGDPFLNQEDIQNLIKESNPGLDQMSVGSVRTDLIESMLHRQIYIQSADVSMNLDGNMNVKVTPRRAIARLMDTTGYSCYMDAGGLIIPWSSAFSPRVQVFFLQTKLEASDLIGKNYDSADINDSVLKIKPLIGIHRLASYLDSSEFWKALTDQVILGDNLELIPRVGAHSVILGDFSDIGEKLNKLMIFYREGLNKVGWNKYSVINLKYKGQVVASLSGEFEQAGKKVRSEPEETKIQIMADSITETLLEKPEVKADLKPAAEEKKPGEKDEDKEESERREVKKKKVSGKAGTSGIQKKSAKKATKISGVKDRSTKGKKKQGKPD